MLRPRRRGLRALSCLPVRIAAPHGVKTELAMDVHKLTLQHNDVHFTRWRQVQLKATNATPTALQRALEALDALEGDLVKQQRAAAQPVPHRYELQPK